MDEKPQFIKQGYGIYPKKHFGTIFTIIFGTITVYLFAKEFNKISNFILLLFAIIFIAAYFLVILILRIKSLRQDYNKLVDEYESLQDNRDTLKKMVENKNLEIENLNVAYSVARAHSEMIFQIAYSDTKPERDIVMKALNIDYKEVDIDEQ